MIVLSDLSRGPWLQAVFFCDQAIRDASGIYSFFGVFDGVVSTGRPGSFSEPVFVIMITGGFAVGTFTFTIDAVNPSGESESMIVPKPLRFDGPGFGHTMVNTVRLRTDSEGITWFDLRLDGHLLTRMPFTVQHEAAP